MSAADLLAPETMADFTALMLPEDATTFDDADALAFADAD